MPDSAVTDTAAAKETTVDLRYVRRLLIELSGFLPANNRPEIRWSDNLVYHPPPTPAQELRRQADDLRRQADRLERAGQLRAEVEQAIAWLDSAGSRQAETAEGGE